MHMVVGFILASLLKKKGAQSSKLPSIAGKFEVVHAIPGRIRYRVPLLEAGDASLWRQIEKELSRIEGIESVRGNPESGSLLVTYDNTQINDYLIHGIALKVLGLENELEQTPESALLKEFKLLGRAFNRQVYQSSAGLLDIKSSLMLTLITLAAYRIVVLRERSLPGGFNLLWWAYVIAKRSR
jgi:copper chaperone CopZ